MEQTLDIKDRNYIKKTIKSYEVKEKTKLDELRELDKRAKSSATITAYVLGIVGTLALGLGMCVAMGELLSDAMFLGIVIGIKGIIMVSTNYFIYKKNLKRGKAKYSTQILELSKELLNENK